MSIIYDPEILCTWTIDQSVESVGLLFGMRDGDNTIIKAIYPLANVWRGDRKNHYTFRKPKNASDLATAIGCVVVGHCHTHIRPFLVPSKSDYDFLRPDELGMIWHPYDDLVNWYIKIGVIQKDRITPIQLATWDEPTGGTGPGWTKTRTATTATRTAKKAHNVPLKHRLIPPS